MTSEIGAEFFVRPVDIVARDLIGRVLCVFGPGDESVEAVMVETEAYGNAGDLASHAAFRPGGRAAVMAGPPGAIYVYSAYGMYPCLNFVTGPEGSASAVLLRGVWFPDSACLVSGPGRTTRALGVTADDHGEQIPGKRFGISVDRKPFGIEAGPRIGITRAIDTHWRFVARFESSNP